MKEQHPTTSAEPETTGLTNEQAVTHPPVEDIPEVSSDTQGETQPDSCEMIETLVERAVSNAFERLDARLKEAEERGYQKALNEVSEKQAKELQTAPTRCNFLHSTRPDIWER